MSKTKTTLNIINCRFQVPGKVCWEIRIISLWSLISCVVFPFLLWFDRFWFVCLCLYQFWWNRVILLQDRSHYDRSFMGVFMDWWTVTVYQSAQWKLICSTCHSYPFLFRLPCACLFMSNSADVSRFKAEDAYPTGAPGSC